MYLAYLDDSKVARAKTDRWQILTAVIVPDDQFNLVELMASITIESLMPEDSREKFEEFHASELYNGHKTFEGIDQSKRFDAIGKMLQTVSTFKLSVAYGAVDLVKLSKCSYRSANPLDMAFHGCAQGIHRWLLDQSVNEILNSKEPNALTNACDMALFIADGGNKENNKDLQNSFHDLRKRMRPPSHDPGELAFCHDDMYFGDSKYSIGIQLADLCGFFIGKHLDNREASIPDAAVEGFYDIFKHKIISTSIEPK